MADSNDTDVEKLKKLLVEAMEWVTAKPWDDSSFLHKRICDALEISHEYPDWDYSNPILGES
ncbi:hypothetical protein QDY63_14655 [Pseudomonas brenneri]|uniref:hypothetical protein n=1 Tax=Pseudomonas brenneri TaxID=129817 RepID=UPI0025A30341|nr:hypothetical protein [Pseudomonas brenneri]WJM94054.1 hypothetical protein QDY63_14655 [Pseudomonas brenneri]